MTQRIPPFVINYNYNKGIPTSHYLLMPTISVNNMQYLITASHNDSISYYYHFIQSGSIILPLKPKDSIYVFIQ